VQVVYAGQVFPESWSMALFLAGPTPRRPEVPSWRPEALDHIRATGFNGVVFVPEAADGERSPEYTDQVEWERQGLHFADRILFWVPRDLATLPGFVTNVEFGLWCASGKTVLGFPRSAPKMTYLSWLAGVEGVGVHHCLEATVAAALQGWQEAGHRSGGERGVPLFIWQTAAFQAWYRNLLEQGNRLDAARLFWSFAPPGSRHVFAHVLWTKIWVAAESRHKENEWVLSRPDVACTVLYHRAGSDALDTQIVLVREFRAPARTADGFVHELPGGSQADGKAAPLALAVTELYEETALRFEPERFRFVGSRQLVATLSSHHAHAFAVELTETEIRQVRQLAARGVRHGVEADSERTTLEVVTVREMLERGLTDWATIGIVMLALHEADGRRSL
jgi:8-oxo-dGTP pyrophosphatase MutT (NUDIX family)